jgi:hypothetical protein
MSDPCPLCGVDESALTVTDAIGTLRGLPRRYREALNGPALATVTRRPTANQNSMLEDATHAGALLTRYSKALPTALHEAKPDVGDLETTGSSTPTTRDDAIATIEHATSALADEAESVPAAAWDREFTTDGNKRTARWLLQHAAHEAAHYVRQIQKTREQVAPRKD